MWSSNLFFFCIQLFPAFFIVQVFQGPGFSESMFFRVQVFLSPGFFGSRFFRVRVQGLSPGFRSSRGCIVSHISFLNEIFYRWNNLVYTSLFRFLFFVVCWGIPLGGTFFEGFLGFLNYKLKFDVYLDKYNISGV